jgi:dienelactone hydrolase
MIRDLLALAVCSAALLVPAMVRADDFPASDDPGRRLVLDLAARRFADVAARFDERMVKALPVAKLEAVWDGIVAQAGAFQGVGAVREEKVGDTRVIIVECRFTDTTLDARVALDGAGKVAGLFFAPGQATVAWEAPPYVRAAAFHERDVAVGSGKWVLPGTLTVPNSAGRHPAVVLVHGSGPNDRDETVGPNKPFKDLAWGLASRGVVVLRYEKRTRAHAGEMAALMKEGGGGFTVDEETVDDARLAAALLAAQPEVDPHRVFVLGHSLGGMLAPRIASGDHTVAGLIILAGNTRPLEELILDQVRTIANLDGKVTADEREQIAAAEKTVRDVRSPDLAPGMTVQMLGTPVPASYLLDLREYHAAEVAATLLIPMLILQGGRDYQVTTADFAGWKRALGTRKDVIFKLYPALNHLFIAGTGPSTPANTLAPGHVDAAVVTDIAAWIGVPSPKA